MSARTRLVMMGLVLCVSLGLLIVGVAVGQWWLVVTGWVLSGLFVASQTLELLWPGSAPSPPTPVVPAPLPPPPLLGAPDTRTVVSVTPPWAPPLNQGDYAALLEADAEALRQYFRDSPFGGGRVCVRGPVDHQPGDITQPFRITHPIWDGPFDDSGSGHVDVRERWWCLSCDGPLPSPAGRPIRLPYLDNLPIQLLPALYARPAFHQLPVQVERFERPPLVPPVPPGPLTIGSPAGADMQERRHGPPSPLPPRRLPPRRPRPTPPQGKETPK